jgi:hypothetical protein
MNKKRMTQNNTPLNTYHSNSNEVNVKLITLSNEFIDIFTKIIFLEK